MNKSFIFYDGFWNATSELSEEQRKNVIYAIVKYGILGEMPKDPLEVSVVKAFQLSLDKTTLHGESPTINGGRPEKVQSRDLIDFLKENPGATSKEVADHFGVSASMIQKRNEWKNRKNLEIYDW